MANFNQRKFRVICNCQNEPKALLRLFWFLNLRTYTNYISLDLHIYFLYKFSILLKCLSQCSDIQILITELLTVPVVSALASGVKDPLFNSPYGSYIYDVNPTSWDLSPYNWLRMLVECSATVTHFQWVNCTLAGLGSSLVYNGISIFKHYSRSEILGEMTTVTFWGLEPLFLYRTNFEKKLILSLIPLKP